TVCPTLRSSDLRWRDVIELITVKVLLRCAESVMRIKEVRSEEERGIGDTVGAQEVDRLLPDPAAVVRCGRNSIETAPATPQSLLVLLWVPRTEPPVVRVLRGSRIRIVRPPEDS